MRLALLHAVQLGKNDLVQHIVSTVSFEVAAKFSQSFRMYSNIYELYGKTLC